MNTLATLTIAGFRALHDPDRHKLYLQLVAFHGAGTYPAQPIVAGRNQVWVGTPNLYGFGPLRFLSIFLTKGSVTVAWDGHSGTVVASGSVPLGPRRDATVHAAGSWSCP